ncbi:MAG: protein-glutamate O-methyltransferase CheR [Candidatus Thiodiazotropha sp.]|jgi:chemotaxis protein methyltransferase CheR
MAIVTNDGASLKEEEARAIRGGERPVAWSVTPDVLSDKEFGLFRDMIYEIAGISLAPAKKALVAGRLGKRLKHYGLRSFRDYFQLIQAPTNRDERQVAIDLLTTNETYFFRETKHFDFLHNELQNMTLQGRPFRVWSAASSSGEEAYSIAMLLAHRLGNAPWEILASDISTRVLEKARSGLYPIARTKDIPPDYLKRFCLKGVGRHEGMFLVDKSLRDRVEFRQLNLNERLPSVGSFDAIFLRNVLIYFNQETKRKVIDRLVPLLRPGGCFLVGHSESLHGVNAKLKLLQPSIYRVAEA